MIPFVVEALKYTTELARDVMAYCLVSQLRKDSNKLKAGDTHYSGWFSALSKFIGSFYKYVNYIYFNFSILFLFILNIIITKKI